MSRFLVLPILLPLVTAVACLFLWRHPRIQRWVSLAGSLGLLGTGAALLQATWRHGVIATQLGSWPAPYGISLVSDLLASAMVLITGVVAAAVSAYAMVDVSPRRAAFGHHPLYHVLLMGVCGAFLTGDLFNLYVWFEVMLLASFVLLAKDGGREQMAGALKYVTLNLLSSGLFLAAIGILYGVYGSLNLAHLAQRMAGTVDPAAATAVGVLFLVAFGIKAAVFPLYFWLPESYHTPPVTVSAVFAGLLTKVGVYALIRVFTLLFVQDVGFTHGLILAIAGLTMVSGVLGAVAQTEVRRILSFHIISQIGYMVMGLGLFTPLALAGSVFYLVHHIVVKTNLFLVSGVVQRLRGTLALQPLGGLYAGFPMLAILFAIPALSLAGLPPLSGFFAKLTLVKAGLAAEAYWIVAAALVVSVLTLLSMNKIWSEVFWKPAAEVSAESQGDRAPVRTMLLPIGFLTGLTVAIGLLAGPVMTFSLRAAEQLLNTAPYVRAVLGVSS